jgi:hypothetical protein
MFYRTADGRTATGHSLGAGGVSLAPSFASNALTTLSNGSSNFALSVSQPVKSAARRDLIC